LAKGDKTKEETTSKDYKTKKNPRGKNRLPPGATYKKHLSPKGKRVYGGWGPPPPPEKKHPPPPPHQKTQPTQPTNTNSPPPKTNTPGKRGKLSA